MKYFEERSRIASDIENTRFMMFLPATSEETYAYIKKCEIQWEIANQTLFEFDILLKEKNNKYIGVYQSIKVDKKCLSLSTVYPGIQFLNIATHTNGETRNNMAFLGSLNE